MCSTIADIHSRLGPRSVPHYVISNCESLSDLLEVAILLKEAGLVTVVSRQRESGKGRFRRLGAVVV